jgi:NADPH:quinone reductase-like Zn-dependent oxidoreductase
MKAYQVVTDEGIDAVRFLDLPEPKPEPGQVMLKVHANSLNYRDHFIVKGGYPRNDKRPLIPLSDGAGEVVEIGEGVSRFKPGDRVAAIFFQEWISGDPTEAGLKSALGGGYDGMLAEYVVLNENGLVSIPVGMEYTEAATLPCAAVTAWQALVTLGNLKAGDTVLLQGTGGVSIFALQFAKIHGARVIITSSSDEKLERARAIGADFTINYKQFPEWEKEVLRLTDGKGVDHVIEVGGPGTLDKSMLCTKINGTVSLIGVLTGFQGSVSTAWAILNQLRLQGIDVGSRDMFEAMNWAIEANQLRPVIDRSFGFEEALDAFRYFQSAKHFGKVVITH